MLLATLAFAAPPSTTLAGERGEIAWTVSEMDSAVQINAHGPAWSVSHTADTDGSPIHTERIAADGTLTTIDYLDWGVRVQTGKHSIRYVADDLWDADTIDIRLATLLWTSHDTLGFRAIDLADLEVHRFRAIRREVERCGSKACTRIDLTVRGSVPGQGPAWSFWYGGDGRLLRMAGVGGSFTAAPAPLEEATRPELDRR